MPAARSELLPLWEKRHGPFYKQFISSTFLMAKEKMFWVSSSWYCNDSNSVGHRVNMCALEGKPTRRFQRSDKDSMSIWNLATEKDCTMQMYACICTNRGQWRARTSCSLIAVEQTNKLWKWRVHHHCTKKNANEIRGEYTMYIHFGVPTIYHQGTQVQLSSWNICVHHKYYIRATLAMNLYVM